MLSPADLPSRFSVFLDDPDTRLPAVGVSVYAELVTPGPPRGPAGRFGELESLIREALLGFDQGLAPIIEHVVDEVFQAIVDGLEASSLARVKSDHNLGVDLVRASIEHAARLADDVGVPLAFLSDDERSRLLAEGVREVAPQLGLVSRSAAEAAPARWRSPLGVLTSDHAGYLSYDLTRLTGPVRAALAAAMARRRNEPALPLGVELWVHPYGDDTGYEVLQQARFGFDAIVARVTPYRLLPPLDVLRGGPRALQNPSLTDWQLSPASFAASPKSLLGDDGCEVLLPASVALQEFVLRQVVRLADAPAGFPALPDGSRPAYVDEYKVSWHALGHSLGEILYSLPLAPGETVRLAVIDWSWDSEATRDEDTRLTEDVLHKTHRDRTISETVRAALSELQTGSSFMGGMAGSSGATGGANLGVVGIGAAVGNAWSLGGSTATSEGSRSVAADNVQRLTDAFSQASSAQREFQSTVVIQARQEEHESIQTRTFSNYNHAHTLTILYYEVLRHYRVEVQWVRRRPALLAKIPERITTFDDATILEHRATLAASLLDPALAPAFDVIEKQEAVQARHDLHVITPSDAPVRPFWEGDIDFRLFEFGIRTAGGNGETDEMVMINLITVDDTGIGRPLVRAFEKGAGREDVNVGERFNYADDWAWFIVEPLAPVRWADLKGFELVLHDDDEWRVNGIAINAFHALGKVDLLPLNDQINFWFPLNGSSQTITWIKQPDARPADLPPPNPAPKKTLSVEEHHLAERLRGHLKAHVDHYAGAILLATAPTSVAVDFDGRAWPGGGTYADRVEPTPLEVSGARVAYPLVAEPGGIGDPVIVDIAVAMASPDPARRQWAADQLAAFDDADRQHVLDRLPLASARSERLVTMPTRGVFAEGKLGHCSVAEEIDNTRFWRWDEHPIPIEAPEIAPVEPVSPTPQQQPIAPTSFPSPVVNIVSPTAAPDPTGLGAALTLLGTANLFRDMSGRGEVAALLQKLSDNTIGIAEAANRAREIQAKYGVDLAKASAATPSSESSSDTATSRVPTPTGATTATASKTDQERAEIDNTERKLEVANDHLPPKEKKKVQQAAAKALADPKKKWTITFKSEWHGETLIEPMTADYIGELHWGPGDSKLLQSPYSSNDLLVWEVESESTPVAFTMLAHDIVPYTGGFSINVPGMAVDGFSLKAATYEVPLRTAVKNIPESAKAAVTKLKIVEGDQTLAFEGTGKIGTRTIQVTAKVGAGGELAGEFARAFEAEATIEILKLAVTSTLKAAVKTTLDGEAAIAGTFEILYLVGYELKQVTAG